MKKLPFLLFTMAIFFFTQCKKDNFPAATMSGEDTFGCRVDGEEWTPKKKPNSIGGLNNSPLRVRFSDITNGLTISAVRYHSENSFDQFSFGIKMNPEGIGIYSISPGSAFFGGDCSYYEVDTSSFNQMEIVKFDREERIVSGNFEFTLLSPENDCFESIAITDGRFDANYSL